MDSEKGIKAGISSTPVILSVTVSTAGNAVNIGVTKGAGYGFSEKAIESVREWKFRPALGKDGAPAPVAMPVEIWFSLKT
jgi:TonB family protein